MLYDILDASEGMVLHGDGCLYHKGLSTILKQINTYPVHHNRLNTLLYSGLSSRRFQTFPVRNFRSSRLRLGCLGHYPHCPLLRRHQGSCLQNI